MGFVIISAHIQLLGSYSISKFPWWILFLSIKNLRLMCLVLIERKTQIGGKENGRLDVL